jgi:tetratricopeptide (TPR) repeat protein
VRDWSGKANARTVAPVSNDAFLAEWRQAIPQPAWWDSVPRSALAINSLGDLLSVWQSGTNDEASRQRFYKLTYQAILDHSGDEDLIAEGIGLMAYVADSDDRFSLLKFGVDHFFSYDQRTNNCANCMIGDTVGEMVRDLAGAYISRGEPEAAIQIIQRLVDERESDVSAYNLALTFETMSRAYWEMKDVDGAKAAIQEGLRRFPNGWQADQLRRTLDGYEKPSAEPVEPCERLQLSIDPPP